MAALADYLEISLTAAREQFRSMKMRRLPPPGARQVPFTPAETLLSLAASYVNDYSRFGSASASRAPEPVQLLARLFRRPPTSVIAKIANLDGSRPHGARWDLTVGTTLSQHPEQFSDIYRVLLAAARAEGIGHRELPDFLFLESGGHWELLGQEELDHSVIDEEIARNMEAREQASSKPLTEEQTTQMVLTAARVGQHHFARKVLHNCGQRCVFCGFAPSTMGASRMLIASHIKPWRESAPHERLDPRNGLAACPTHDVAFDTGLLTVNGGLRIHVSPTVSRAAAVDPTVDHYFARPLLREQVQLPSHGVPPDSTYLSWHRENIYVATERSA